MQNLFRLSIGIRHRSSYREFVLNRRKSADRGSGTSEIAGPSRNGRIGFYHATRSDRVRGAVKAVCRFMLLRWRFRGPNVPVRPASVFASRESLGKTTPPGRCCTPFPSGEQPLAGNCAAGTSVLGTAVRSGAPLWGTAGQHWAQPSSSAALPPRRALRPNPALGVCATARAVCAQCIGLRGVTHQQKCTCGEMA